MSEIIVQKYGGSSVATPEKIINVANRIKSRVDEGKKLVVVISAMGKTTDSLIKLAHDVSKNPHPRELDMLLATGEQISVALVSMALNDLGASALSLNAFQAAIKTTKHHTTAKIVDIDSKKLLNYLEKYDVLLVTGFQGINEFGDFTTLGRGGSDTSAVAIAAKLGCPCEIYSDVAGVYTTDPKIYPNAKKLKYITYDDMLELAGLGAKVLHSRSVEIAKKYKVPIYCGSSFSEEEGTWVVEKLPEWLEEPVVTGATLEKNQVKVSVFNLPNESQIITEIFSKLADKGLNVDMISLVKNGTGIHLSFSIVESSLNEVKKTIHETLGEFEDNIKVYGKFSKVSVVGVGMKSHYGVAARFFKILDEMNVEPELVTTSEIKISCLVSEKCAEELVRKLCEEFGL